MSSVLPAGRPELDVSPEEIKTACQKTHFAIPYKSGVCQDAILSKCPRPSFGADNLMAELCFAAITLETTAFWPGFRGDDIYFGSSAPSFLFEDLRAVGAV